MERDKTFQGRPMKNVYKWLHELFSEHIEISHHERAIFISIKPQTIHKIDPLLLSISSLMATQNTKNGKGHGRARPLSNKLQSKWCWLYTHILLTHLATEATCNAFTLRSTGHRNANCGCNRLHTPGMSLIFETLSFDQIRYLLHLWGLWGGRTVQGRIEKYRSAVQLKRELSHSAFLCHRGKKQYKRRQKSRSQVPCWSCIFPQRCRICCLIAAAREKGTQKRKLVI